MFVQSRDDFRTPGKDFLLHKNPRVSPGEMTDGIYPQRRETLRFPLAPFQKVLYRSARKRSGQNRRGAQTDFPCLHVL